MNSKLSWVNPTSAPQKGTWIFHALCRNIAPSSRKRAKETHNTSLYLYIYKRRVRIDGESLSALFSLSKTVLGDAQ